MNQPSVLRGDVFEAELNPTQGSEQSGRRPVVVISRDAINKSSPVVIVIPVTDAAHKPRLYPSHVLLPAGTGGLVKDSVVICEQVRAISKNRLTKQYGRLNRADVVRIEEALKIALDLA